jgi:hypothetical protein
MASSDSSASGIAHHPGACVETPAAQPSRLPARDSGDAP